jgi:transcription initiation factor TFIIA large subunit
LAEWKAEVARRRAAAAKAGAEPDRILMDQMRDRARRMEGGGLMVPLDEYTPSIVGPKLKSFNQSSPSRDEAAPGAKKTTYQELIKAQYDGPGSDNDGEVADEDAINSDLDDPDDIIEGSENDEEGGTSSDIMLCTYDKVQRVKNKWKCTLKDGLMTTGGKE